MRRLVLSGAAFALIAASQSALAAETVASLAPQMVPERDAQIASNISTAAGPDTGVLSRALSKADLFWTGQLNGPSFNGPIDRNYNAFQNSYNPLYIYHTLDSIYHLDSSNSIGVELSAKQDVSAPLSTFVALDGTTQTDGVTRLDHTFTLNDPQFWIRHSGLLDSRWLKVDVALSVFPGLTDYSRNQDHALLSTALDGTYHVKIPDYRWNLYFTSRVRPTVYSQGGPFSTWKHEELFLSTGHYLSYHFNSSFELAHSTAFDCDLYKGPVDPSKFGSPNGNYVLGNAYDDRTQLELNYYVSGGFARVGLYAQSLIWNPALDTSIVGVDLTFNFLTAKW
jgi:hypothetical protein